MEKVENYKLIMYVKALKEFMKWKNLYPLNKENREIYEYCIDAIHFMKQNQYQKALRLAMTASCLDKHLFGHTDLSRFCLAILYTSLKVKKYTNKK